MHKEPELRIVGDQELRPVTAAQLDLALRMLGYEPTRQATPEEKQAHLEAYERKQAQTNVNGNPYGNRAQRRANRSKRGGPAHNGRRVSR